MDAFNLCVGKPLLSRESIKVPVSESGISYEEMRPEILAHGYALFEVSIRISKKQKRFPIMAEILGFESGVFFVEFFWNKPNARDFHVIAVNCDQRCVYCNTLGCIPFAANKRNESTDTHAEVVANLYIRNVFRVFRVVQHSSAAVI